MKIPILCTALFLSGCLSSGTKPELPPLSGRFYSHREKPLTIEWINEDGPSGEYVPFGNDPDGDMGSLIHEWNEGRLSVIVPEEEDEHAEDEKEDTWVIVPNIQWFKQFDNIYFSSEMGIVLRIISNSKY